MTHMDNQESQSRTNLKTATFSIMGLIALFENDHVNESIRSDLVSVRDNIEKQIEALSIILIIVIGVVVYYLKIYDPHG